jgi:hypothetical protein
MPLPFRCSHFSFSFLFTSRQTFLFFIEPH